MYEGAEFCQICKDHPTSSQSNHGARYLVPFSPEFPRFEVRNQYINKPSPLVCYCKYLARFPCLHSNDFKLVNLQWRTRLMQTNLPISV